MKIYLTEKQFKELIYESFKRRLLEAKNLVDNFNFIIDNILTYNSNDDFYFVQIIKRAKDNPLSDKSQGNYHAGGWYLKSWRIRNAQELIDLKPEIIKICNENNARAYITINSRSEKETNDYIKIYKKHYNPADPRYQHADEIVPGMAKDSKEWKGQRPRLFLDIDVPKDATYKNGRNIWNEVHYLLDKLNIQTIGEYETPSGGLHILLPNKEERSLYYFKKMLPEFDDWKNMGKQATVHPNVDGKIILYSNTETKGY